MRWGLFLSAGSGSSGPEWRWENSWPKGPMDAWPAAFLEGFFCRGNCLRSGAFFLPAQFSVCLLGRPHGNGFIGDNDSRGLPSRQAPGLGRALALAGVYSYGIYLFHQPYVMYAGEKLRPHSLGEFLVLASAVIVLVALGSMCLEYAVNRTVKHFFP